MVIDARRRNTTDPNNDILSLIIANQSLDSLWFWMDGEEDMKFVTQSCTFL